MSMTIDAFAKQYLGLARFRGLTPRNPVPIMFSPNANDQTDTYRVIVSHTEPSFADVPYNVIWLVANSGDPLFMSVLLRTSHISDGVHRSSWKALTQYDELFRSRQIYRRVVENASSLGLDVGDFETSPANTTKLGTVILNLPSSHANEAVVVSSSDPRMSDARTPTDHDHPDYARTMVRMNEKAWVEVASTNAPQAGYVLAIVDQDPTDPNKFYARWVKPTTSNVAWSSPRLLSLKISIPSDLSYVPDNSSTQLVCTAEWENRVENNPAGVMWKIEENALGITINGAGVVTVPDIGYDVTLKVTASMKDPVYGNIVTTEFPLLIKDIYRPDDQLTRIYITGAKEMFAQQREAFMVVAEYESGHTVSVLPNNFTSNSQALVLTGMIGEAKAVNQDTTVTLAATYNYKGIIFEAEHKVLVKRQVAESLEIIGAASVLSEQSVSYLFEVTWSNGRKELVTPTRFDAEPSTFTEVNGATVTAKKTTEVQYVVTLRAQYRGGGVLVEGKLNLTILPVPDPAFLSDLKIEGATVVQENTKSSYQFLATYSDGSVTTVNPQVFESNRSDIAVITGNTVSFGTVNQDTIITLTAKYTEEGITKTATLKVTILDVTKPTELQSIRITGATSVQQNTRSAYKVIATYTDQSQRDITEPDSFVLAQPSNYATVEGLTLVVGTVPVPLSPVTLNAVYQENGIRKTANFNVSLIGHEPRPVEILIEGADTINELSSAPYKCRAMYSDNTNRLVDAVWTVLQGAKFAEVDSAGVVTAGSVDKNETILLRAQALGLTQEKSIEIINVMDVALTGAKIENLVPAPKYQDDVGVQAPLITTLTFSDSSVREAMQSEVTYTLPAATAEFYELATSPQAMLRVKKKLDGWYGKKTFIVNAVVTVDGITRRPELKFDVLAPEDEVTGYEIQGASILSEGTKEEYKLMVKRLSGSVTEFDGTTVDWQLPTGNAELEKVIGKPSRIVVNLKYGKIDEDAQAWLEARNISVDGRPPETVRKIIDLVKDKTQPTGAVLEGPIRLTEGQKGTYKLRLNFADGSHRYADNVVVSYGGTGTASAFTFHGDDSITANKVTQDELVLIKGQVTYLGKLQFATLFVTNVSSTPSVEILSIIGTTNVLPESQTQYRATAAFSDGNTEEVTTEATWSVIVKSGTVTATAVGGLLKVGATDKEAILTLVCSYGGEEERIDITVTPQPVDAKYTPRWGAVPRVTSMAGYNKAFAESLTKTLTDSGDQIIETQGEATSENGKMLYTLWHKSLAYGFFRNITDGEGPVGAWDGAAEFDDFNFEGGIDVKIEGEDYVIFRIDFPLEQHRRVYRIRYGSSEKMSGMP